MYISDTNPVWMHVKERVEERLTRHRASLEGISLSHDDNLVLKARIAECRAILETIRDENNHGE
jgi:hypothetical protein